MDFIKLSFLSVLLLVTNLGMASDASATQPHLVAMKEFSETLLTFSTQLDDPKGPVLNAKHVRRKLERSIDSFAKALDQYMKDQNKKVSWDEASSLSSESVHALMPLTISIGDLERRFQIEGNKEKVKVAKAILAAMRYFQEQHGVILEKHIDLSTPRGCSIQ